MFRDPASLGSLYPALVRHAMHHFQSPDVMRFLGRKLHPNFQGEVTSSYKRRLEGARVKHWANGNSVKMYDKGGNILRVETTMANTADFKSPLGNPSARFLLDFHRVMSQAQRASCRCGEAIGNRFGSVPWRRCHSAIDP